MRLFIVIILLVAVICGCDTASTSEQTSHSLTLQDSDNMQITIPNHPGDYLVCDPHFHVIDVTADDEVAGFKWYYRIESKDAILTEGIKTGTGPQIAYVNESVVRLTMGYGSNATTVQYFDLVTGRISQEFDIATDVADYFEIDSCLIAYLHGAAEGANMGSTYIIIQSVFDDMKTYRIDREFISVLYGLEHMTFIDEKSLYIEYYVVVGATNYEFIYENKGSLRLIKETVTFA